MYDHIDECVLVTKYICNSRRLRLKPIFPSYQWRCSSIITSYIEYYKYTRHIQFMAMLADEEEMSLITPYRARDSAWLYSLKKTLALVSNLRSGPLSYRALWNVVDNMAGERLLGAVIKSNSLANIVINNILVEGTTGGKIRYNLLYY